MDDFQSVFLTNNYKIQINILYNTKEGDDTNTSTDELDSNYYIIDNMQDILLEEFSDKKIYDAFKNKYKSKDKTPLYIVNDSFYIDKYVIDTIRRTTSGKFPAFGQNEHVEAENFKNNIKNLKGERNDGYQNKLVEFFKKILTKMLRDNKKLTYNVPNFDTIETLDKLFTDCKDLIKKAIFKFLIKNQYESTRDSDLKEALRVFYNISNNSLGNKFKYEYFLDPKTISNIFKFISESSSNEDGDPYSGYGRRSSLNNNQTKEDIYNKYFKYVFPNKKDITNLSDQDKDKIIMFYNVYYIIKNIYLLDNTIINVKNYKSANKTNSFDESKYYISQVSLLDLKDNITHFKIEKNKVTIFVKATLKYIIENPILQINYLIDDLENAMQNFLPQTYILQPKDLSGNYSSYDKIYIHDKVKYVTNIQNIETIAINSRKRKYIKNKEELFLNTKALKLFNYYFRKQIEKHKTPDDNIIALNIKYLLYKIFKFYNNKEFKKYYIADTYIKYFGNDNSIYYSITKGDIKEGNVSKKYKTISSLFAELSSTGDEDEDEEEEGKEEDEKDEKDENDEKDEKDEEEEDKRQKIKDSMLFQKITSSDARLSANKIYKINVVFRCYLNKTGKKPDFVRKIIAERCLTRAQKLDEAFTNTLYRAFDLPENYLYNKLTNITRKQKPNVELENKINPIAREENIAINMPNKRGGKVTKKYNHNKNSAKIKFINNIYQL